jgi:flagellar hook-associated protein 2
MSDFKLGGIVSGLNTNDLIRQLMQIERQPIQLMKSRQNVNKLKKDLLTEINTSLLALKTANDKLLDVNSFKKRTATTSNDAVVTATAGDGAAEATYNITITKLAQNRQIRGDQKAAGWQVGTAGDFRINDGLYTSQITVAATDTLQIIADKINAAKDMTDASKLLRVSASVVDNTLMLSHDEKGSANTISFSNDTGAPSILTTVGLITDTATYNIKNSIQLAENAAFTVNGISVSRAGNDNLTDVISGVTLNLKSVNAATITVKKDVDTAYKDVKAFIDQYNSTIDLINTRLSEEKVKKPLSDSDLKKGLMRGESILTGIKGRLRMDLSDPVAGLPKEYDRLSVIGITTTSDSFGKSGKLQIDETKFKNALTANPDAVIQLFTNNTDINANGKIEFSEKGVAVRVSEELKNLTDSTTRSVAGVSVKNGALLNRLDTFDKIINDYDKQILRFEDRLKVRERALWAQFTALEKALSNLNNQSSWLAGQLAGLSSNRK